MSNNKLALNRYDHDAVVGNSQMPTYMVRNYKDEVFDYDAGANAKFEHDSIRINPQSGLANVFTSGSEQQIDFIINPGNLISHFDKIQLRCTIGNGGAAAATVLPSHFMINLIEVMVSGATIEEIYPQHLLFNDLYLSNSDEEVINDRSLRNYVGGIEGTLYTNPATLAAGASRSFYVEIPCVFSKTKCFMDAIRQVITFRIHFSSTALVSTSLATTINLLESDILIDGRKYDDVIKQKLIARYKSYDHVFGYYMQQRSIIAGQTISNTTRTTVTNTAFGGYHSGLVAVFLCPAGANREELYSFAELLRLDLQRNGSSISNFQNVPADFIKAQMGYKFYTTSTSTENIYCILQSNKPVEALNYGRQLGCNGLTNNDQLLIQAETAGTYDVYVLCYRFANFIINKNGAASLVPLSQ